MNDPKIVRTFTDRGEAEIALGLLEAEGITGALSADDLGENAPALDFSYGIKLMVAAEDAERARALLDEKISEEALDAAERESENPPS